MNTPTLSQLFSTVSGFVKGHSVIVGWIAIAGMGAFNYFASAEDFNVLKKEFVQYRFEDIAYRELESTRRQLDNLKQIPEADRPQWVTDQIDRLLRQEKRLEDKISNFGS